MWGSRTPHGHPDVYPIGIPAWCVVPHLVASGSSAVGVWRKSTPNPKVPCNSRWFATNKASVWLGVFMGCWAWGRWKFLSPWVFVSFFQTWVGFWFPVSFRNSLTYFFAEAWESRLFFFGKENGSENKSLQKFQINMAVYLHMRSTDSIFVVLPWV